MREDLVGRPRASCLGTGVYSPSFSVAVSPSGSGSRKRVPNRSGALLLWLGLPSSCRIHTQPAKWQKSLSANKLPTCETRHPLRVDYTVRKEHTVPANRIKTGFVLFFCGTRACVVVIYAVLGVLLSCQQPSSSKKLGYTASHTSSSGKLH